MSSGNLRKKIFRNIIISSFIIALALFSISPAFATTESITYEYFNSGEVKKTAYGSNTSIDYVYDGSGNWLSKTITLLAEISATPSSLDFGAIPISTTSQPQTITITNTGAANLTIGTITLTGTAASEFIKQTDTCTNSTITPSNTCQIQITFNPLTPSSKAALLSIPSNDPGTPNFDVPLSGTGILPQYTLTVSKTPNGSGTVTSSPEGINCDLNNTDCTEIYNEGTEVILTASPASGSTFTGWQGACTGSSTTCLLTMNADTAVAADFEGCTYSISPTNQAFGSGSGSGSISLTTQSSCDWTATSNDNWITITSGTSGTGNGTINYTVEANTGTDTRTGTITIWYQTFTITQDSFSEGVSITLSCPASVTAGNPLSVTVNLYNWNCNESITTSRLMTQLMGNSGGTLSSLGLWGPYNNAISTKTAPAATCDEYGNVITPGAATPFGITVMNSVPTSLTDTMAEITVDAITSSGESSGSGNCVVNVQ